MTDDPSSGRDELAEARQLMEQKDQEIRRLRERLEQDRFAEDFRDALTLAAAAGTIGSPVKHQTLVDSIVRTAAHVIGAQAASLFLIDEQAEELVFEVAIGPKAEEVKKFRVPIGQGIAGLVAMSGQPMAVSNADEDPRLFENISQKIGYEPESILCVPLFYEDRVIGVLEMLDKAGARSFAPQDMEALGLFAQQAAVALELSISYSELAPLIAQILASLGEDPRQPGRKMSLLERSGAFADQMTLEPAHRGTVELAELVQRIAWEGEDAREACRSILRSFADFLAARDGGRSILEGGAGPDLAELS